MPIGNCEKCKAMGTNTTQYWYYTVVITRISILKTLDTIAIVKDQSSPHHLVYLNIHMHKIKNLRKFELNWSSMLREKKIPLFKHEVVCFQMLEFETSKFISDRSRNQIRGKLFFSLKNYVTSEGPVSHNVLYYQQLPNSVHCL